MYLWMWVKQEMRAKIEFLLQSVLSAYPCGNGVTVDAKKKIIIENLLPVLKTKNDFMSHKIRF